MPEIPIQYLHLETGILPLFLGMMIWTQLARAADASYFTQSGRTQAIWLSIGFGVLTVAFGGLLYNVSPLLAIELAAGVILSLMHPVNALCFFIHMLVLRPWEIATSNPLLLALPRMLAALCCISWMMHPGLHAKLSRPAVRALVLLLGFSFWLFLSTFQTPHAIESQIDWLNTYFKSLIVFIMCLFFIESEKSVTEFELTLVISALALMIVGYYHFFFEGSATGRLETFGMIGDSNDLAAVIILAIPFALVPVFSQTPNLFQQSAGLLYAGFSVLVIWFTRSRGALLALLLQLLAVRVRTNFRERWIGILLLAIVLGSGYIGVVKTLRRSQEDMRISAESRIIYWNAAINMALHHPLLGVGFNQFPDNYEAYGSNEIYEWGKRTAHSSWLLALAESGVMGGLLYVTFFLKVLRSAWRNRERRPEQLYAMVGYGTTMTFLSHTYLIYPYLLSGLIYASDAIGVRNKNEH